MTVEKPKCKNLEVANSTIEAVQARREAVDAAHREELRLLEIEQVRLSNIRAPYNRMLQEIEAIENELENAAQQKTACVAASKEFADVVTSVIGKDVGISTFSSIYSGSWKHLRYSDDILPRIDAWVKEKTKQLEALRSQSVDYANANGLAYLLPK